MTAANQEVIVNDLAERDWTDKGINQAERKKSDRILSDGIVLQLMKKSDWEGCKRFLGNMGLMALTAYIIHKLDIFPSIRDADSIDQWQSLLRSDKMLVSIPLFLFYGFQMQCMAFAGGHELIHGSAFKTKWMNTLACFFVSTAFFEVSWHEKLNHKQHHIYTLDINRDPELTSFYSRKELENLKFKSVPASRYSYIKAFINLSNYFQHRICRLVSSSLGIVTDVRTTKSLDLFY